MQKCPIYLYPNLFEVILDLDQNTRVHNIMYQRDIKIQKGLKNRVQIQFKNSDQKLLPVSTGTFVFSMFNGITQQTVVKKVVTMVDDGVTTSTRGLGVLELNENDTFDLDTGFYQFTVAHLGSDGSYEPTYSNTYYGTSGRIELRQDSFPLLRASQQVLNVTFEADKQYNFDQQQYEFYSGNLSASPEYNGNSALHTMAFYLNRFKGTIKIQGTQNNSPQPFNGWATIQTLTYTRNTTAVNYANFQGVWSWVRVIHIPEKAGAYNNLNYVGPSVQINPTPGTAFYPNGKIDKLLYRC